MRLTKHMFQIKLTRAVFQELFSSGNPKLDGKYLLTLYCIEYFWQAPTSQKINSEFRVLS